VAKLSQVAEILSDISIRMQKTNLSNVMSVAKVLRRSQMLRLTNAFTPEWTFLNVTSVVKLSQCLQL
jgi:hypothetical protein